MRVGYIAGMNHPILRHVPGARQWIRKIERLEAERDRLALRLQKLQTRVDALPQDPPRLRRDQYKAVWTQLSETTQSAKLSVGGFEEEASFESTGVATRETLSETVGINPTDVVVEIGCGVGRVGKQVAPLCCKWIGCDVSPRMLTVANKRLEAFSNVELQEVSGFDLRPLADESADLVYSTIVFMHLETWDRYNYVREAWRVLRPGGRFFVDNVNLCSDEGWRVFELHREFAPSQRPPHITKHSTLSELVAYLERAGFTHIQGREPGQWVQVWAVK